MYSQCMAHCGKRETRSDRTAKTLEIESVVTHRSLAVAADELMYVLLRLLRRRLLLLLQ